jgi:hypothetical protein
MELVANSVAVPLVEIERALLSRAVPGSDSTVVIYVQLQKEAAHEIKFQIEWHDVAKDPPESKRDTAFAFSNERAALVRNALQLRAEEFRLFCPVSRVTAKFKDGRLSELNIAKVEECFA